MDDLNEIANVEAECFPAAEAATKEEFVGRIRYYGNHFWIATVYKGNIIKINNGLPILRRDTAQTRLRAVFL